MVGRGGAPSEGHSSIHIMEENALHGDGGCVCRMGEDENERKNGSGGAAHGKRPGAVAQGEKRANFLLKILRGTY